MIGRANEFSASLVFVLVTIACLGAFTGCDRDLKKPESVAAKDSNKKTVLPQQDLVNKLNRAGWSEEAAKKVIELNSQWFQIIAQEDSSQLQKQIDVLCRLGRHPQVMPILECRPEAAGLLASADNPEAIAKSLQAGADYRTIANLYVIHAAPGEAARMAEALANNRHVIVQLQEHGLIGSEKLFVFERKGEGSTEYERWLRDILESGLRKSDKELSSLLLFISVQGREIRRRLTQNKKNFRRRFRSEIWPRLQRVAAKSYTYDLYMWDPHIWDVLSLPEGELLLKKWGLLPADLLFGSDSYPPELRSTVIRILLTDNKMAVVALEKFRRDQLYHDFIRRTLPSDCQSKALYALFQAGPSYTYRLSEWARLTSDAALCEDLSPPDGLVTYLPFYYCYYVPKKLAQGGPVRAIDLAWIALDVGSFFLPPIRGATAVRFGTSRAIGTLIEPVSPKIVRAFETTLKNDVSKQIAGRIAEDAAARIGRKAAEDIATDTVSKLGKKAIKPEMVGLGLSRMQSQMSKLFANKMTFEVTRPVRAFFKTSPLGRETFRKLTGLEARLFMRGDAKVLVVLPKLMKGPAARFLAESAHAVLLGAAADTETGKHTMQTVGKGVELGDEILYEWKKHVSAWWLMCATAM